MNNDKLTPEQKAIVAQLKLDADNARRDAELAYQDKVMHIQEAYQKALYRAGIDPADAEKLK